MEIILKYFPHLTERQKDQFSKLEPLYREWNSKINVVSRKDIDQLYERHILHSLAVARIFHFKPESKIMDLGTGGGFPGIPLAIIFPEVQFLLVDSILKKLKVIDEITESINLKNVITQHTRAEDMAPVEKYNFIVSRAVAPLKKLWTWSKPILIRKQGDNNRDINIFKKDSLPLISPSPGLICLKGGDLTEEIQESNTKPVLFKIKNLFAEEYFDDKYVVHIQS